MKDDWDNEKAVNFLLWGKKGYQGAKDQSPREFSIEKMLNFLKGRQDSTKYDDI